MFTNPATQRGVLESIYAFNCYLFVLSVPHLVWCVAVFLSDDYRLVMKVGTWYEGGATYMEGFFYFLSRLKMAVVFWVFFSYSQTPRSIVIQF